MSMLFKRIKDWATSITAFRSGDVIPVDGPSGTAKMPADDLAKSLSEFDYITSNLKNIYNTVNYSSLNDLPVGSLAEVSTILNDTPSGYSAGSVITIGSRNAPSNCVQIFISASADKFFYRRKLSGAWAYWNEIPTLIAGASCVMCIKNLFLASIPYSHLTEVPVGTIAMVSAAFDDRPESGGGYIFVAGSSNVTDYVLQIYVSMAGNIYTRFKRGGSWGTWQKEVSPTDLKRVQDYGNFPYSFKLSKLTANDGHFISIYGNVTSHASYFYSDSILLKQGEGIVVFIEGEPSVSIISEELVAGSSYKRLRVGKTGQTCYVWENWSGVDKNVTICGKTSSTDLYYGIFNALNSVDIKPTISLFGTIAALGDSYTAGSLYDWNTKLGSFDGKFSWVTSLGKRTGVEVFNHGIGGATTRSAKTHASQLPKILTDPARDLYLLTLGLNDYTALGPSYLGTPADMNTSDYTQSADSFYGNYYYIIKAIQAHAPNAIIIMLMPAPYGYDSARIDWYNACLAISSAAGIACIDTKILNDYPLYSSMEGGHPTIRGYAVMSVIYQKIIEGWMMLNDVKSLVV